MPTRGPRASPLLALALLATGCVERAPPPFTLAPGPAVPAPPRSAANGCAVAITELLDARSDPETLGVYAGKAIKAPADRQSWLRNIVLDLEKRGVRPLLGNGDSRPADTPRLRFVLEKAWVSNVHDDIGAGVLLRIDELGEASPPATLRFRGTKQKMTYFSAGESKLQASFDDAVAQALDAMAAHLLARCESHGRGRN